MNQDAAQHGEELLSLYRDYLRLEKNMTSNTVEAYTDDVGKLLLYLKDAGLQLFDHIFIGIGVNKEKSVLSETAKRVETIKRYYKDEPRVSVQSYDDLTIDFARRVNAKFILRGLRSVKDFEYERDMADMNRKLTGVETVILFTEPPLAAISSSVVRDLISHGLDVSEFLPKNK